MDSCNHRHLVQSEDGPESHVAAAQQRADDNEDAAFARATGGIRTAALFATARALDLLNQLIVLWLVILGNLFAWAAVQFKDSDLPKTIAQYSLYFGAWSYKMCKQWNVHGYAAHLGGYLIAWLSSIDRETGFSCKIICSMAAILGAVARVAEESTRTCA
ncbi:hypothetical protein EV175_000872 [Coemansia sp. RSA 1933]|nr:hypothetical protein EV175_000872 [Coemansia sp. RSA 1933]